MTQEPADAGGVGDLTFPQGTASTYNKAVTKLTSQVVSARQAAAKAKADYATMKQYGSTGSACVSDSALTTFDNSYDDFGSDLGDLNSDISQAATDDNGFADDLTSASSVTHALYTSDQEGAVRAAGAYDTTFHAQFILLRGFHEQ